MLSFPILLQAQPLPNVKRIAEEVAEVEEEDMEMETLQRKNSTLISTTNTNVAATTHDVGQTGNLDASVSNPYKLESADEDYIDAVVSLFFMLSLNLIMPRLIKEHDFS